ncbi:oligogalacturonide transport system permease protein [Paenibacillus sp. UNCCL117]|uniref:carbohydrate ABC transporter permease n=1 Tax=unclassified Paenibacillus TaxID=185978 RepID=UPI00087E0B71|nr:MULTISPECIES: carbohydrate ABC transporter permease [unclassified Paenibacillus]SDD48205.1 carbohydrate ABC transporter membrane protein 2, CUT1 family [Paenibacillus sp. cl123]SFW50295.1 oligogalacturonide transport system permease protein [Paenibacillus sp. UNCCL117]
MSANYGKEPPLAARLIKNGLLALFGLLMIYPLIWLFFSSFKTNADLFGSLGLLPERFVWDAYGKGWTGTGQYSYAVFFGNTLLMVVPTVVFTVVSSAVVAYGFARFQFPLKGPLFALMISTLMLPHAVIIIPRYLIFRDLGWLDSYWPFIVPALFACYPFFIFMMVQFFRGLPRELDESAVMDGCNPLTILTRILLPLCKPALFSAAIFQFIWTWNDFFNSLIFINSVKKYTVSLALRMTIDSTGGTVEWNQIMAMSVLAVLPPVLIFFFFQRYFVEGIATTGIKG